jgi:hypothetical protein
MIVTFKDFHKLKFPLYILPSDDWYIVDGVLFLQEQVVDERRMPGETLGIRRLQCGRKDLLPLRKMVLGIPDLIQAKNKFFIDSSGYVFIYEKTLRSKLKAYRIKRVELKETKSLIWLYDWPTPFTVARPPAGDPEWVRFLHYQGSPWIVYDYVRPPLPKETYRRV